MDLVQMNSNEISRLAHAVNDLRPDWPISSLTTFITNHLAKRTYRDASVALAWIATDAKPDGTNASATPRRVLENGPWWQAATVHDGKLRGMFPPKKGEDCAKHPGQWSDNCGGCAVDPRAWDGSDTPPARPSPGDHAAGKAAALAAMGGEQA